MSRYTVTDPTTNKSVDLEGDSPPTEQELEQIFSTVHGQPQQHNSYGMSDAVSDIGRPLLEGGGAIAGGMLGAPLGPIGAAGGGALGFAGGKAAADLMDRGLGRKAPIPDLPSAIKETGSDLLSGGEAEATGQVAGKIVPPLLKGAGKFGAKLGEWATNIPTKDFESVARNPMSMRPGAMEQAGDKFSKAMSNAGISSELTPEAVDRMRQPGQFAFDTFNKLKTEGSISPQEALHGRQSIDAVYPIPNKKNGSYIRMLDQIRDAFQEVISNSSPEIKDASKDYAIAKSAQRFKSIFPQTNSGKPAYFRTGAILGALGAGHPEAILGVPAVAGTLTAGAGAAGSVAKSVLGNPASRRMATSILGNKLFNAEPMTQPGIVNQPNNPPEKIKSTNNGENQPKTSEQSTNNGFEHPNIISKGIQLTKEKAREFLDKANGVKELARELAQKAGYTW